MKHLLFFATAIALFVSPGYSLAQKKKQPPPKAAAEENDYYKLLPFTIPEGEVLEAGAIEIMPDGKVAVGTRRGEIWMIDNAYDRRSERRQVHAASPMACTKSSAWLHKKDGWLYVTQRRDVTRIKDTTGNGKADIFRSRHRRLGDQRRLSRIRLRLPLRQGRQHLDHPLPDRLVQQQQQVPRLGRQGHARRQIRADHQRRAFPRRRRLQCRRRRLLHRQSGPVERRRALKQLVVGGFVGHPDSFKWYKEPEAKYLGNAPPSPQERQPDSRRGQEDSAVRAAVRSCSPTARWANRRAASIATLSAASSARSRSSSSSAIRRTAPSCASAWKRSNGRYQGACYPFRPGFGSGIVPVRFAKDGSLFVGGTNRGWGSRGNKPFAIERLVWTGKIPFEIHEMHAKPDGFELTFTKPVDPKTAGDVESYR